MPRSHSVSVRVARRLKMFRTQKGYGQIELEELAGLGRGTVGKIESGQRGKGITIDVCLALARTMGLSLDELVGWKPPE